MNVLTILHTAKICADNTTEQKIENIFMRWTNVFERKINISQNHTKYTPAFLWKMKIVRIRYKQTFR